VIAQSGDNIRVIRESVREGFRLDKESQQP